MITIAIQDSTNAGNSSYIPNMPPMGLIRNFHMNTMLPPVSIPAIAPALVVLFQKSDKIMSGPNVAPKPAHAKDTTWNITLRSSKAIIMPNRDIARSVIRDIIIICLSVASLLIIPLKISRDSADEAMSRYESDELIVAARIPDMITPASSGGSSPVDITIKIFSAELLVRRAAGYNDLPIKPIATAAKSEITHQTIAILLDFLSSEDFVIAINLKSTCGMPKYPRPQDMVEIIVSNP